ncbi:uracil-xanthine permease family protein [Fusibacter ferrireducens]|uniref:Uracil-xanthine permease n=1 Tax=Fusibacter ferrireducens TaxID=2785058 RepID=A0ABR9ZUE1_9FIRM|nr:uracil-xanthine permease family protein [Fusibacter ferrireducens]MBF4694078.1 uracil-xanthine permease [Fusibacter ferrireducens]
MSTNSYAASPSTLSDPKNFILGLQHLIAMFGATVLVPILTGFNPSVALFTAGCGTLIFHACTSGKVPVFLGSSFAFIPLILQIKELYQGDLAYAQGGIIVAGFIYVLLSFFVKAVGVDHIKAFLPAHVVGPMIIVIGLNLVPTAFGMAKANFLLAGVTLATALIITFLGKGFLKQLSILIAVVVGYTLSLAMHAVDFTSIQQASLLGLPAFTLPKFSLEAILIMAPVVLAVFMEHVGDITTNGTVVGKNFIENPGLHRTLLGDGIATMFAGLLGGPANTTYGENTGVLAITKNYNPAILRIAAVFAIVLSLVGKLGGVLGSIPTAVMGGISLMLFSMIALIGVRTIKNQNVVFNVKNILIMLLILFVGLAPSYVPSLALQISIPNSEVALKGLSLAALLGVIVNGVWTKLEK